MPATAPARSPIIMCGFSNFLGFARAEEDW
jgi:hypothetical protein